MLWFLILGITMLLSFGAMAYLKSVYARASQVPVASGLTGAQTAARIRSGRAFRMSILSRAIVSWVIIMIQ